MLARHWTEAGEIEPAIAEWSRAGKTAQAGSAFWEAQESYEQAMSLATLLPESPERDNRELDLRQSVIGLLYITRGFAASETKDAIERAAALAEKGGNLKQLVTSVSSRVMIALFSGDLPAAAALADQGLKLALREGSPIVLGRAHHHQQRLRVLSRRLPRRRKALHGRASIFRRPRFPATHTLEPPSWQPMLSRVGTHGSWGTLMLLASELRG